MSLRNLLYFKACLAYEAHLYDDLVDLMKAVTRCRICLKHEEFILLCRSLQIKINKLRFSWKTLKDKQSRLVDNDTSNGSSLELTVIAEYLSYIENEIRDFCIDNINLFEEYIVPNPGSFDILILGERIIADNYRYIANISHGYEKQVNAQKANELYKESMEKTSVLAPSHPTRLRVVLNYSLFLYKILNQTNTAIELTKNCFTEAFNDFTNVNPTVLTEVMGIMQLLRDNLNIWTNERPNRINPIQNEQGQGDGMHVG